MFYRGFDGPLLRQRFLEGNDTHEIKLILAVSRNANVQRAKFYHRSKGLAVVRTESLRGRRGAWPQERWAGGAQNCWRRPQESAVWETVCHVGYTYITNAALYHFRVPNLSPAS